MKQSNDKERRKYAYEKSGEWGEKKICDFSIDGCRLEWAFDNNNSHLAFHCEVPAFAWAVIVKGICWMMNTSAVRLFYLV